MTRQINLEIPDNLMAQVEAIALQCQQSPQDVLVGLIDQATHDLPLDYLPDEQILKLCNAQMPFEQQEQLNELLSQQREETLSKENKEELDHLMQVYRQGLIQKAKANKIAVERKLRPSISSTPTDLL